jgi:hypothetical protein
MTSSSSHRLDSSLASSTPRTRVANGNDNDNSGTTTTRRSTRAGGARGPQVRLMCSFGGRIQPCPGDRKLRYVGGRPASCPSRASRPPSPPSSLPSHQCRARALRAGGAQAVTPVPAPGYPRLAHLRGGCNRGGCRVFEEGCLTCGTHLPATSRRHRLRHCVTR